MEPTALIYSSHNRCNYIHNDWIVQRALKGDGQILFLTLSEGEVDGDEYQKQVYSWSNFAWFFDCYKQYGLNAYPFYWNSSLRKEDVDLLSHSLDCCEVVMLGGGNPTTGLRRYKDLGSWFYNDRDWFENALHNRQEKGLLNVGFSAGVDQLCQFLSSGIDFEVPDHFGFGLCRNIIAFSHFEHGREGSLMQAARKFGFCQVFGLPNDSGLALNQGILPSGNYVQWIQFIIDNSWDKPYDQHHIKTRQGVKIQHIYPDGRHWAFNGGDMMLRFQSPDNRYNEAFIIPVDGPIRDYWTQQESEYRSIDEIMKET